MADWVRKAGEIWGKADRALGGWLPGGGTASPITKAVFPAQPFPARSKELEEQTGIRARFVDLSKTPTLVRKIAPKISQWGTANYANPILGQVGMAGYQGGATPAERHIEYHELGHLNPEDKGLFSYFGVGGRYLQGISNKTGNLPPVDFAAGLALQYADAPEEDRAERFSARFAKQGGYTAPDISPEGRSAYGDRLRKEGRELTSSAVERVSNPWGIRTKVQSFVNPLLAKPLQAELNRSLPAYREALQGSDATSSELLKESERLDDLARRIKALGVDPEF